MFKMHSMTTAKFSLIHVISRMLKVQNIQIIFYVKAIFYNMWITPLSTFCFIS